MSENAQDPYATPEAVVTPDVPEQDPFASFPRVSAWWVFLLIVVTFGLYAYYWLVTRVRRINEALPANAVDTILLWAVVVLSIASGILAIFLEAKPYFRNPVVFGVLLNVHTALTAIAVAFWIVLAFAIRNRINIMSGATPDSRHWANGILALFATPIYTAYKINQVKDSYNANE